MSQPQRSLGRVLRESVYHGVCVFVGVFVTSHSVHVPSVFLSVTPNR
jgi:hypothetical protein